MYRMWDSDRFPFATSMAMFYVLSMALAREPKTQVAGITMVGDMSGMTRKHVPSTWQHVQAWAAFMKVAQLREEV